MLNPSRIKAITLDLDDTLWPIWPTIARAETALTDWLADRAPATVGLLAQPEVKRQIRADAEAQFAHLAHDLGVIRREAIRLALQRAGDDPALAEPAFEVFFDARHQVDLFADALPALEALSARYPLVALTNGNADIGRVGLARYFKGALSAREFGVGKPDPRIFHAAAQAAGDAASRRVLVSSPHSGEGKTFCAVNLAIAMAGERDGEVLLVDADIAKPSVLTSLGLPPGPGFLDALSDERLSPWKKLKALGASHGINRQGTADWVSAAREWTGGRGVDHVLEGRRQVPLRAALSNSFAFGGSNAVLAFRAPPR